MKYKVSKSGKSNKTHKGFTLIELIVAMALSGILLAVAVPPFFQWRNNVNYRQTARQITSMLREARSFTIANNVTHSVLIRPSTNSYRMLRNSMVVQDITAQSPVLIRGGAGGTLTTDISVTFNSNGTAVLTPTDGNIFILDGSTQKFLIKVTPTGRISLQQKY